MKIESVGSIGGTYEKPEGSDAKGAEGQEIGWEELIARGSPSTLVFAVSERKGWSIDRDSFMHLLAKVGEYKVEGGFEIALKLAKNSLLQEDFLDFMCESFLKDLERLNNAEETVYVPSFHGRRMFEEFFRALASNFSVSEESLRKIAETDFGGDVEITGAIQKVALQTLEAKTDS